MNLNKIRQLLQTSRIARNVIPACFGTAILVSSSCSNVKQFASRGKSPAAVAEDQGEGVKHAYTAKKEQSDFVKLLEFKMNKSSQSKAQAAAEAPERQPTVQELMASGQDPFLSISSEPKQPSSRPAEQAIPERKERSTTLQEAQQTPDSQPRPFVDSQIQLTSGADNISEQPAVEAAAVPHQQMAAAPAFPQHPEACPPGMPTNQYIPPNYGLCPPTLTPEAAFTGITPFNSPEMVGDEYIHDGGDRGTKVYYSDYARFGLDVEDTIGEWNDEQGVAFVKPSTRATIYAPKFSSVRSASLPQVGVRVEKVAGHHDGRNIAGMDTKIQIDEATRNDEVLAMRYRNRPSGLDGDAKDDALHQNVAVERHVKLLNAHEQFRFFRDGQLTKANTAVIGDAIAAAFDWSGDRGVVIYAHDQAGQEVQGRFTAQDYTVVEDRSKPGDLQIVKVVDKNVAKPGDELTFTIRFDNVGDRPVRNVRIVDNLSPRLKYVDGSVDSDLDGKLDTQDNGQGSQILTFTFEEGLKGHTGGWVSFRCIVR